MSFSAYSTGFSDNYGLNPAVCLFRQSIVSVAHLITSYRHANLLHVK